MLNRSGNFTLSLLIICFLVSCGSTKNVTVNATENIPYFTFTTLDNNKFTKDSFDTERTKFIYYFNSECEHCEKQGKWLAQDMSIFDNLEVIFISFEEMDAIKNYRDKFNFTKDNITFLQDSRLTFSDKFGVEKFPSILLYNKKGKLIKKFEGETKVKELNNYLK